MTSIKNLRSLRKQHKLTMKELGDIIGVAESTISLYENGKRQPDYTTLQKIANYFHVSVDYLLGRDDNLDRYPNEDIVYFDIIGSVSAGYGGVAVEEFTGDSIPIPKSMLHNQSKDNFFVLRVKGDSMYPQFLDGDSVLVQRCTSVDSGSIAVVLYNSNEATIKKVVYNSGEDWLELIPTNPEYAPKRIEGLELEECRVLGKVIKLIRDVSK